MGGAGIEDAFRGSIRRFRADSVSAFRNTGEVYRYFEFPAAAYQDFLSAESRGRFFRSHIRDHFRYERMAKLRAA